MMKGYCLTSKGLINGNVHSDSVLIQCSFVVLFFLCFFSPSITALNVVGGGWHTITLVGNGSLFSWGYNYYGQLGDGTTTDRQSPVSVNMGGVLNGKNITQISAGYYHTIALSTDGFIFSWGENNYGQLGDGTTTDRSSPVSVDMVVC